MTRGSGAILLGGAGRTGGACGSSSPLDSAGVDDSSTSTVAAALAFPFPLPFAFDELFLATSAGDLASDELPFEVAELKLERDDDLLLLLEPDGCDAEDVEPISAIKTSQFSLIDKTDECHQQSCKVISVASVVA